MSSVSKQCHKERVQSTHSSNLWFLSCEVDGSSCTVGWDTSHIYMRIYNSTQCHRMCFYL